MTLKQTRIKHLMTVVQRDLEPYLQVNKSPGPEIEIIINGYKKIIDELRELEVIEAL